MRTLKRDLLSLIAIMHYLHNYPPHSDNKIQLLLISLHILTKSYVVNNENKDIDSLVESSKL